MQKKIVFNSARIIAAVILLQTLYFKFTGHPESMYIFQKIGMEPVGRVGVGVAELLTSVLLFIPGLIGIGALLGTGLMVGAIGMHLTILGIEVKNDGGYLFILACVVLVCSFIVLWIRKKELLTLIQKIFKK